MRIAQQNCMKLKLWVGVNAWGIDFNFLRNWVIWDKINWPCTVSWPCWLCLDTLAADSVQLFSLYIVLVTNSIQFIVKIMNCHTYQKNWEERNDCQLEVKGQGDKITVKVYIGEPLWLGYVLTLLGRILFIFNFRGERLQSSSCMWLFLPLLDFHVK